MTSKAKCEAPALGAAVRRMIRALENRAAEGDTEALEELLKIDTEASSAISSSLGLMREMYSLAELSRVTGTSRPAVLKRSRAHTTT